MLQNTRTLLENKQFNENSEYERMWVEYLFGYGNKIEYEQIARGSKNAMFSIMEYRRLLRSRGLGNIPFITLNTAYIKRDYIKLHSLLQELFLEVVTESQFQFILEQINNANDGMIKLYDSHIQDKNKRVLNRVLFV